MAKKEEISKGLLNTAVNAYEPSNAILSNPYNTQATRDVAAGKSGIVGNTKAGDKVYNPKSSFRSKLAKSLKKKFKELKRGR